MKLTDEQKALYRAVADGKRIELRHLRDKSGEWALWKPETMMLGYPECEWRVAPETITIPKPVHVERDGKYMVTLYYNTDAERDAGLDAIKKALACE